MESNLTLSQMLDRTMTREISFNIMIDHLSKIKNPLIVETGCARPNHDFAGDGFSTFIFDCYIKENGGELYSIDINSENIEFAKQHTSSNTVFFCDDSVNGLWKLNKKLEEQNRYIDLLYLDSFDFDHENYHDSSFHHMKELTSIISRLSDKSMISVDDNFYSNDIRMGKGMYVEQFMKNINCSLIYDGYQLIWKM